MVTHNDNDGLALARYAVITPLVCRELTKPEFHAEAKAPGEDPPAVEEAALAYHLRARRATRKLAKQDGRAYPRFDHAHRNDLWQGDMTGGLWLPNPLEPSKPRQCFLHAFIDDHARYVPHAQFYFRQNLTCLLDGLGKAVHAGGVCSTVRHSVEAVLGGGRSRMTMA